MRKKNIIVLGGLLAWLGACTSDPNETKLQYFPDMATSAAYTSQGNYIDPPEGAIARSAILYPETAEEAEKVLQSPLQGNMEKHLESGKHLFETYCSACHGHTAKGDGTVIDKFVRPPDLTMDFYKNRKDGYYFHRITFGGAAVMPSYGHSTDPKERWEIIAYLRTLQNAASPGASTPPAAPASTPSDAAKGVNK